MSELSGIYAAAAEQGIDVNSLDEDSNFGDETQSMEAEGEATEDVVKEGDEVSDEDDSEELGNPEGEETEEAAVAQEVTEDAPKLTAKEHQELQAARDELAQERKAFTEERAQVEKELREQYTDKIKKFEEIDAFLAEYAANDPDAFDLFRGDFQKFQRQYSNPVIDSLRSELQTISQELGQFKAKASDEVTLTKLDSEMEKFMSATGKDAEAAGIKVDRKVIEDLWAKGLTVEEAFHAKYGANYVKAKESKAKVATSEKKVQGRPAVSTAGNVSRSNTPVKHEVPKNSFDAVKYFARQLTGKAS